MIAARLLVYEGDGSANVGLGRCGYGEFVYGWYTWFRCLASAGDVLEISVVRGVGGVYNMCKCLARGGVGGVGCEWVTGLGLGFTNSGGTLN